MSEQFARVGDVELCYETFGDPEATPMLLIMGLGTQMIGWNEEFCEDLAGRGFFVTRFDNRDCGRSTHFRDVPPPGLPELITRRPRRPAYTLREMAADSAGLLDHLGIEVAHVVGASMGGMIGQTLAVHHPERVRSLVSIMSTTGGRFTGAPAPSVIPTFLRPPARDREGYVEGAARLFRAIGSPGFERDEAALRDMVGRMYDRGVSAAGTGRQLAAIMASGNRFREVGRITAPTLVIHGTADKLVSPSGGRATARAIPGARLMTIEGMGHDLPRGAWPRMLDAIEHHAGATTPGPTPVQAR